VKLKRMNNVSSDLHRSVVHLDHSLEVSTWGMKILEAE
jgi:hypothetical protein